MHLLQLLNWFSRHQHEWLMSMCSYNNYSLTSTVHNWKQLCVTLSVLVLLIVGVGVVDTKWKVWVTVGWVHSSMWHCDTIVYAIWWEIEIWLMSDFLKTCKHFTKSWQWKSVASCVTIYLCRWWSYFWKIMVVCLALCMTWLSVSN